MKNVQVTIDQETLARVDRVGKTLGLKRSEIVRQALRDWLHRHAVESFEGSFGPVAFATRVPDNGTDVP